jgi:hypothetical protein
VKRSFQSRVGSTEHELGDLTAAATAAKTPVNRVPPVTV